MKFIETSKLKELYEEFQKYHHPGKDFQCFVEQAKHNGAPIIIDTTLVNQSLKQLHDEGLRSLLQCEDEDLRWFGAENLEKVNFLKTLLDDKDQLTMQDIKFKRKKMRVGFELIELKTDGSCFMFIIRDSIWNNILGWKGLPEINDFKEYLKNHSFPEDRMYSEQDFLNDVGNREGFICFKVEKIETAEFICRMIYDLFE
jgi:hypothetical protein